MRISRSLLICASFTLLAIALHGKGNAAQVSTAGGKVAEGPAQSAQARHTFSIGPKDFLLDGKPIVIRCGEMHFARVPREYWRHRLQLLKAMGMNSVCAYLFWNYHEREPGKFNWSEQADAAEFCRIAQEEGLWVILRPGPYACAEWNGGGLPWWLLKNPNIRLRSQDPDFHGGFDGLVQGSRPRARTDAGDQRRANSHGSGRKRIWLLRQ